MTSKINIPAKVLSANVSASVDGAEWPFDDGQGDPYWTGGVNSRPYQWEITMTVDSYTHGSHLTRQPFTYNGLDVYVGDWIAGGSTGTALKIISITSKTATSVTCVVEDVLRYNTFRSPTGTGIFNIPGQAVIFEINEEGYPVVDPLPLGIVSPDFIANLQSRFQNFNTQFNFILSQPNNGFVLGDVIAMDTATNDFVLASQSTSPPVGTVVASGPGPNQFIIRPTTKIVENVPALIGEPGDLLYVDNTNPGSVTTVNNGNPIYLKLTDAVPSEIVGSIAAASTSAGNIMSINGVDVTIGGTGTISDAVSAINGLTSSHGVIASQVLAPNVIQTNNGNLAYGLVGNFTDPPGPASASINGTFVQFSTNTAGVAAFGLNVAIEEDMATDINAASPTNIIASFSSGVLILTETSGGPINIVNANNDRDGNPFAGPSSGSGLPLNTAASTDTFLKLERADGGGIILQNETGAPVDDFGLVSVQNGVFPLALQIEQGIRRGDTYVVSDIAARDALNVSVGDQVFVMDKNDGEWGHYIWNGSQFDLLSTQESARTDSRSLSVEISPTSGPITLIGEVSDGSRVNPVTVDVVEAFNGNPLLTIGDSLENSRLFDSDFADLGFVSVYETTPSYQYNTGNDTEINVYFNANGATLGRAVVTITYS